MFWLIWYNLTLLRNDFKSHSDRSVFYEKRRTTFSSRPWVRMILSEFNSHMRLSITPTRQVVGCFAWNIEATYMTGHDSKGSYWGNIQATVFGIFHVEKFHGSLCSGLAQDWQCLDRLLWKFWSGSDLALFNIP